MKRRGPENPFDEQEDTQRSREAFEALANSEIEEFTGLFDKAETHAERATIVTAIMFMSSIEKVIDHSILRERVTGVPKDEEEIMRQKKEINDVRAKLGLAPKYQA